MREPLLLLLDPEWRDSFGGFASSDFYSDRLVDLNLPTLRGTPRGQWRKDLHEYIGSLSDKELRLLVESIVMAALMAAIQKAGIRGSPAIFERLGLAWYSPTVDLPFFGVSLTIFFVLMTAASLLIDILRDPMHLALGIVADAKNQCVGLWPCDFNYVIREMVSYACPAVLAIVAGLILWATRYESFLHESRRQVGGGWLSLLRDRIILYSGVLVTSQLVAFLTGGVYNLYLVGIYDAVDVGFILRLVVLMALQGLLGAGATLLILIKLEEGIIGSILSTPRCLLILVTWMSLLGTVDSLLFIRLMGWGPPTVTVDFVFFEIIAFSLVGVSAFLSFAFLLRRPSQLSGKEGEGSGGVVERGMEQFG